MPTFSGTLATGAAQNYCTLAETKAVMPDTSWGSSYDAVLAALIERASRAIDMFTGRWPGAYYVISDSVRYFDGNGKSDLFIDELASAPSAVHVAETGDLSAYSLWSSSDYFMKPYNASQFGMPYEWIGLDLLYGAKTSWPAYQKAVKITGKFGYSLTTPSEVKQATIIQAVRWFKRGQQAFRDTGAIVELGQLTYTQAVDPDVAEIISHLRRLSI